MEVCSSVRPLGHQNNDMKQNLYIAAQNTTHTSQGKNDEQPPAAAFDHMHGCKTEKLATPLTSQQGTTVHAQEGYMAAETDLGPAALHRSTPAAVPSTAAHASCTKLPIVCRALHPELIWGPWH